MSRSIFNKNPRNISVPIFIWGSPRSGTTLLNQLVAAHPNLAYPENSKGTAIEGTKIWYEALGYVARSQLKKHPSRRVTKRLHKKYTKLMEQQQKDRVLSKVLLLPLWMDFANEVFPDARHIHIIRDGRAVVNSILYKINYSEKEKDKVFLERENYYGPQPEEIEKFKVNENLTKYHVMQWTTLVNKGMNAQKILGNRYYQVFYEDFVAAPRYYIKRIFDFCNLSYTNYLIEKNIPEQLINRNMKWRSPEKFDQLPEQDKNSFTKKSILTNEHLQYFYEEPTYSLMRKLGYEIDE